MKHQHSLYALLFVALLAGTSCSHDTESGAISADGRTALQVTSGIQTRAYDKTWEVGDAIGIYMTKAGVIVEKAENRRYVTAEGNSAFTPSEVNQTIYFPVDGSEVDFIAYYPCQKLTDDTYQVNVSNQSSLPAIDLMTSTITAHSKLTPAVAFLFQHRLTKLELNITAGKGISPADLKELTVTLTKQRTAGTYSPLYDTFGITAGNGETITLNTAADGTGAQAILLPNDVANNTPIAGRQFVFTLKASGEVFYWTLPDAKSFNRGDKNIYNITINRTAVEVTATITDWNKGNEAGEPGSAE